MDHLRNRAVSVKVLVGVKGIRLVQRLHHLSLPRIQDRSLRCEDRIGLGLEALPRVVMASSAFRQEIFVRDQIIRFLVVGVIFEDDLMLRFKQDGDVDVLLEVSRVKVLIRCGADDLGRDQLRAV